MFRIYDHKNISHRHEERSDIHIRDLQMTSKGHARSKVMMHFYQVGVTVNIFVYKHLGPRSNRYDTTLDFHFFDLEMTRSKSPKVKCFGDSESS